MDHPVVYNIKKGTKEYEKYNKVHKHLAYELRNKPYSPQTTMTDIYSLGYNFKNIGYLEKIESILRLSKKMTTEDPFIRYNADDCLVYLLKG